MCDGSTHQNFSYILRFQHWASSPDGPSPNLSLEFSKKENKHRFEARRSSH